MNRFDEASKTWEKRQSSKDSSRACLQNLRKFVNVDEFKKILDYGCGTGFMAFELRSDENEVLGMDFSDGMIEEFNKKVKEQNLANIKAVKHDMRVDDLQGKSFDLFVSSMTMHHIKDTKLFASKAHEALSNGGIVCISDLVKEDGSFHNNNDGVMHFGYDLEDLKEIFKSVGFEIIFCDEIFVVEKNGKSYPLFNLIGKKC